MSYFEEKKKHAYMCYKNGVPRKKVYAVVEKEDKYVVIKTSHGKYKYMLAGGGIEEGENEASAIKRECIEELNMKVSFIKELGIIRDTSSWEYNGEKFVVEDLMHIVLVKYESYSNSTTMGVEGEFDKDDIVVEIDKKEMLENVAEFKKYGIKLI